MIQYCFFFLDLSINYWDYTFSMSKLFKILSKPTFQNLIGKKRTSRFVGKLADKKNLRKVLRAVVKRYIKAYDIDMSDYELDVEKTKHFNDFFTRRFKPGKRVFTGIVSSPVEGYISAYGSVDKGKLLQVKGSEYELNELLGEKCRFENSGSYATLYLSPADYHRVHAPFDMKLKRVKYIPGTLYSVSEHCIRNRSRLYCRNERVILEGTSSLGEFYIVLVGAIIVGRIKLSFDELFSGNMRKAKGTITELNPPLEMNKGDELAYFELGSTVILIMQNIDFSTQKYEENKRIILGQSLIS